MILRILASSESFFELSDFEYSEFLTSSITLFMLTCCTFSRTFQFTVFEVLPMFTHLLKYIPSNHRNITQKASENSEDDFRIPFIEIDVNGVLVILSQC